MLILNLNSLLLSSIITSFSLYIVLDDKSLCNFIPKCTESTNQMIAALKILLLPIQISSLASPTHLVVKYWPEILNHNSSFQMFFFHNDYCFSGLNLHPGSKRKSKYLEVSEMSDNLARLKRLKQTSFNNNLGHLESDSSVSLIGGTSGNQDGMNKHTTHNCLHTSPCAVEDSLFKGSTRSIPSGCCFNFDPKARIYT